MDERAIAARSSGIPSPVVATVFTIGGRHSSGSAVRSTSARVFLPAPGGPVTPISCARPVFAKIARSKSTPAGASSSTSDIARATARGLPASTSSASVKSGGKALTHGDRTPNPAGALAHRGERHAAKALLRQMVPDVPATTAPEQVLIVGQAQIHDRAESRLIVSFSMRILMTNGPERTPLNRSQAPGRLAVVALVLLIVSAAPAFADATVFIGSTATPANRPLKGLAFGVGVLVLGFEFEFAQTGETAAEDAPSLNTGMGNVLLQTPIPIAGIQFYLTAGGGLYRERLGSNQVTHFGVNSGAGAKISLLGPIRARLDYRVFRLRGEPLHEVVHRVYAGLNLGF